MTVHRQSVLAYRFGPFRLSIADRILERGGERLQLTPKVIDTLFVLLENSRQVVTKEALMKAVWPDVTVVESGLTRNISALRKALEQDGVEGAYIETVPKRGYRFVAEVTAEYVPPDEEIPQEPVAAYPQSSSRWAVAGVAGLIVLGTLWWFVQAPAQQAAQRVEPAVRIGEYLLYKMAPDEAVRAAEHFERAIALNPDSADAHAGLSMSLLAGSMLGVRSVPEILPRAETAAVRALTLNPDLPASHEAMALIDMIWNWDFSKADAGFRRALQLAPDSVEARRGYARLKLTLGDHSGAQRLLEEALHIDPASPATGTEYCKVFYYKREFLRAETECRNVLERERDFALGHYYLALSQAARGRAAEARKSFDRSGLMPGVLEADRAWLSLLEGDPKPATTVLQARRELIRRGNIDASAKLLLASALNRMDEVYEALEAGLTARAPELLTVHIEPRLDSIRSDARYKSVIRRIGIPSH